jgi:hypothetical protein
VVAGVDFGALSGRAVVVAVDNGEELGRSGPTPRTNSAEADDVLYAEYSILHDYFGRGANEVMHRLRDMKRKAVSP